MTNEEKIRQIRVEKLRVFDGYGIWMDCVDIDTALLEMAEWKDKQDESWLFEVKEVDLEEEICSFFSKNPIPYKHITDWPLLKNCAIHFFELGLKAQKGE